MAGTVSDLRSTAGVMLPLDDLKFVCSLYGFIPREIIPLPNLDSNLPAVKLGMGAALPDSRISLPPEYHLCKLPTGVFFDVLTARPAGSPLPAVPELADQVCAQLKLDSAAPE